MCQHLDYWLDEKDKGDHILVLKRCKACGAVIDQWTRPK